MPFVLQNTRLAMIITTVLSVLVYIVLMNFVRCCIGYVLGDKSVSRYLRNPIKLIEPVGFIFLYIFGLGWCQEIEFNSRNFSDRRQAILIINIAPIILGILLGFLVYMPIAPLTLEGMFIARLAEVSFKNSIFNMLPIRPLFGEKIFRALGEPNTVFKMSQNEKTLQILMVFLLIFGIGSYVTNFIWHIVF